MIDLRYWSKEDKKFIYAKDIWLGNSNDDLSDILNEYNWKFYININDANNKKIFIEDIIEFDNGDKVVIKMGEWLEVLCCYTEEPKRDHLLDSCLGRLWHGEIITNTFEDKKILLEKDYCNSCKIYHDKKELNYREFADNSTRPFCKSCEDNYFENCISQSTLEFLDKVAENLKDKK